VSDRNRVVGRERRLVVKQGSKHIVFAATMLIVALAGIARAGDFSADMTMATKEGKMTGTIWFKPDRYRMDLKKPEEMTMITRADKKVTWHLMPSEKMYMEMPYDPNDRPKVDEKMEGETERKLVADEKFDGRPTKKYLITCVSGKKKEQFYQWWAADINFAVKTAALDGSWSQEFRNVKTGPQPNILFVIPAGYKKMQMPGGMGFRP
jgi:hypothetical protein